MVRWSRLFLAATLLLAATCLAAACVFDGSGLGPLPSGDSRPADSRVPDLTVEHADLQLFEGSIGDRALPDVGDAAVDEGADAAEVDQLLADTVTPDAGCPTGWQPGFVNPCAFYPPGASLVLDQTAGQYLYDTTMGTLTGPLGPIEHDSYIVLQPDSPNARLVVTDTLTVAAGVTLRVVGSHPLILVVFDKIEISGTIDASSGQDGDGAGAGTGSWLSCASHAAHSGTNDYRGAGGGGGGGLGYGGGKGGDGHGGGGAGGSDWTPAGLRGGCVGARGGNGDSAAGAGAGGAGGGAVALLARTRIDVHGGVIEAGGAAGSGATSSDGGGGGGGSGGMIVLDAHTVDLVNAVLAANGGGGGGGADNGGNASRGDDGLASADPAPGGWGSGGDGGAGGARATPTGTPGSNDTDGAGGGGGGAGIIKINCSVSNNDNSVISPLP